jgi:hypothetical protein
VCHRPRHYVAFADRGTRSSPSWVCLNDREVSLVGDCAAVRAKCKDLRVFPELLM